MFALFYSPAHAGCSHPIPTCWTRTKGSWNGPKLAPKVSVHQVSVSFLFPLTKKKSPNVGDRHLLWGHLHKESINVMTVTNSFYLLACPVDFHFVPLDRWPEVLWSDQVSCFGRQVLGGHCLLYTSDAADDC